MKVLCLLICLGLPLTATSQKASPPTAPELIVIDSKLGRIARVEVSRSEPFPRLENQGPSLNATEINPPRYEWQVKAEFKLQNTGVKDIKSVSLGVILMDEVGGMRTIKSMVLPFPKSIRSGHTVKVSQRIRGFDLKAWSRSQKAGLLQVQTHVYGIEYADGSVWAGGPFKVPPKK